MPWGVRVEKRKLFGGPESCGGLPATDRSIEDWGFLYTYTGRGHVSGSIIIEEGESIRIGSFYCRWGPIWINV